MTTDQLTQEIMHLKEYQAQAKAEHDKFQVVLTEVQDEIKENRELTIAVKEIATEMKHLREEQTDINKRLKVIEEKPSKNWDNLMWIILTRDCNSSSGIFIRKIRIIERI